MLARAGTLRGAPSLGSRPDLAIDEVNTKGVQMAPPTRVDVDLKDFLDHVATEQLPGDSHEYRVDILITYPDPRSSTGSPYETRRLFIQGPHGTQGHCIGTLDTVILHGDDQPWTVRLRQIGRAHV